MKRTRLVLLVTLCCLLLALPAGAGILDLTRQLESSAFQTAPPCPGGNCDPAGGQAFSGFDGILQQLLQFFREFIRGIVDAFRDIGGGTVCNPPIQPPTANPPTTPIPVAPPPVAPPVAPPTTENPPVAVEPPTSEPPAVGEVPQGSDALTRAIQQKFNVRMIDGRRSWTEAQLRAVYKTLSVLPENFRRWNRSMTRDGNRGGIAGMGQVGGSGMIWLYDGAFNSQNGTGIGTIVHEMTHNFQGNDAVCNTWRREIRGRSCTSYGNTNWREDMAESVKYYYLYGAQLKRTHPSRYEFIKNNIMQGVEFRGDEWK